MSIVQNTLIGRARQKIGGSVFSTWKGKNVLKSKPLTVANPKTPGQVQQRSAMEQTTFIFRQISGAVNLGFKQQAVGKSEFNAFASYNLKNAFDKSSPGVATFVPAEALVSQGTITATPMTAFTASHTAGCTATWDATQPLAPGQSNTDVACLVVYDDDKNTWGIKISGVDRTAGTINLTEALFPVTLGDGVEGYLFFYNTQARKSSDSLHRTTTAV